MQFVNENDLNDVQKCALKLIKNDLSFLYTVITSKSTQNNNYIVSLLPYIGVIIDGTEDWIKVMNNSSKCKVTAPLFKKNEQCFYEKIRISIKLWQNDYHSVYSNLQEWYNKSDEYFSNVCKPIAKELQLYDIFGVDFINGIYCGNTILYSYYYPDFSFGSIDGRFIRNVTIIGGKYINGFDSMEKLSTNDKVAFEMKDYGGFTKSPVGNKFSERFVLFSILCQLNFVLLCVDNFITTEISTKLRFLYLLYYSLTNIIPEINCSIGTNFFINTQWKSDAFRNAMAHYKLGVALKPNEINKNDKMFGLTNKYFKCDYINTKKSIIQELSSLAKQIESYLGLKNYWTK